MSQEEKLEKTYTHGMLATSLFNRVWDLMEQPQRSHEEEDEMLHAAHASRYHWGQVGTPLELVRGEWQLSRVYSLLKRMEPACFHALRCLQICKANDIGGFDLAFAYEALSRANALAGDREQARFYYNQAKTIGEAIPDEKNRDYFLSELTTIVF